MLIFSNVLWEKKKIILSKNANKLNTFLLKFCKKYNGPEILRNVNKQLFLQKVVHGIE
jgi:hypothetical protein